MSLAHCRTWRVQRQPETNSTQNRLCSQTASEASLPPSLAVAFPLPYIYIGHPGWKALGARTGYSIINGIFILAICLTGTMDAVLKIIPIEAGEVDKKGMLYGNHLYKMRVLDLHFVNCQ